MIYKILKHIRLYIANYYKAIYKIKNILNEYAIDESDFVKLNGNILWVIGVINTWTKLIRL